MKQSTSFQLPVEFIFDNGLTFDEIEQIEFVFKQTRSRTDRALKSSIYKADGGGDAFMGDIENVVYVPWFNADVDKFKPNCKFYMDTRISVKDSSNNPQTPIVELTMNDTLFLR